MSERNAEQESAPEPDDTTETDVDHLAAQVAAYDEELAAAVASRGTQLEELEATITTLEEERDDLESKLKRERADFQNYKKRMEERTSEIRDRATEDVIERLVDVRDNLLLALQQDDDADLRDGVEATFSTFERVLSDENVEAIEPDPGDEVDPTVHEVMMRVDGTQQAGTIEEVYRPGYEMAGKVLRPAQVTVSEGSGDDQSDDSKKGHQADSEKE